MAKNPPGKGLFGWLGRQFGHVRKAVHADVGGPKTVYRANRVEEKPLEDQPGVKLRRTVIDEVIGDQSPALGNPPIVPKGGEPSERRSTPE
jgi:hypothetical protein